MSQSPVPFLTQLLGFLCCFLQGPQQPRFTRAVPRGIAAWSKQKERLPPGPSAAAQLSRGKQEGPANARDEAMELKDVLSFLEMSPQAHPA